jgi:hypothetical protein
MSNRSENTSNGSATVSNRNAAVSNRSQTTHECAAPASALTIVQPQGTRLRAVGWPGCPAPHLRARLAASVVPRQFSKHLPSIRPEIPKRCRLGRVAVFGRSLREGDTEDGRTESWLISGHSVTCAGRSSGLSLRPHPVRACGLCHFFRLGEWGNMRRTCE